MMRKIACLLLCLACVLSAAACYASAAAGAAAGEWTITLDYNDGVSRNGTIYVEKGNSVTLSETAARKGYSFAGWQTQSGEAVDAASYTPDQDTTLVAQWEVGKCTLTLADAMTGETLAQVQTPYGAAPEGVEQPEKKGYVFRYWSLTPDGERLDLDSCTVNGDMTVYAVWLEESQKEYYVNFHASAYSADHTEDKVLYVVEGGSVKKADAVDKLERDGYKFEGWTEKVPAEGTDWTIDVYPAKKALPDMVKIPLKPKKDTDLYAVWSIQQYVAIFNANYTDSPYANDVVDSQKLLASEPVQAPAENPSREGYSFAGWYTKKIGGEQVSFEQEVRLTVNTGYYAHWIKEPVVTDTFQAEYTEFDPDMKYFGYSGSVQGTACIVKDAGVVGTVDKDDYPTNSVLKGGNGYYVSYQYEKGDTLRFVIHSDKACTATLAANLAVEVDSMVVANTGDNATAIYVNGEEITYSLTLIGIFQEQKIAAIQLQEGENVIEFVVANENTVMGGTYRAVGFMTDYIKLLDCDAELSWSPIYDNLENM